MDPTISAVGTWSGGRFMRFGRAIDEDRLLELLLPDERIATVISADVYGEGAADALLGRALARVERDRYCLVGAIGHDFYSAPRAGAKGYPRFSDPRLRGPERYREYLEHAARASLQRLGVEQFDLLLLHNPDRRGYRSDAVWEALAHLRRIGLTRMLGVAPGPANGFTLDLIACLERFSELIDWAMIILSPLEPWPGELVLAAAQSAQVKLITRVVDYGGLLFGDIDTNSEFPERDHRAFRPPGWIEQGLARIARMTPYADAHALTPLQLACAYNLAHEPVACVVPTLIQEVSPQARPIESKRAELGGLPALRRAGALALAPAELAALRAIGDNTGTMALKGASAEHTGAEAPDRWALDDSLRALAARYGIDPERTLAHSALV
jgi:aryl-alcohol dehydrogenase-like predicted oxidoreductase